MGFAGLILRALLALLCFALVILAVTGCGWLVWVGFLRLPYEGMAGDSSSRTAAVPLVLAGALLWGVLGVRLLIAYFAWVARMFRRDTELAAGGAE